MRKTSLITIVFFAFIFLGTVMVVSPGYSITIYASGSYYQESIGDQMGTVFDKLYLDAMSGSVDLSVGTPIDVTINMLTFVTGTNSWTGGWSLDYSAVRSLTINGTLTQNITQSYRAYISYSDTLYMDQGPTSHFDNIDLGSGLYGDLDVTPLALTVVSDANNIELKARFLLTDTYTVPEPGILILLGIAMSAIGAVSWRLRKL